MLLIIGLIIIAYLLSALYAACVLSGRITEAERRQWFQEHGTWPDW